MATNFISISNSRPLRKTVDSEGLDKEELARIRAGFCNSRNKMVIFLDRSVRGEMQELY